MLSKARIAVFVSGGGTNLEALLKAQESGAIPHGEIVVVLSSTAGAYALERAKNHGVPGFAVPRKGMDQAAFETALSEKLTEYRVDLIVLAGFLSILSEAFVQRWPDRIVNIHPSLIPAFCGKGYYGLKVHEAALSRGVKVTGAWSMRSPTADAFCCRRRWRSSPATRRRSFSAGSWSRRNGSCCPRRRSCSPPRSHRKRRIAHERL